MSWASRRRLIILIIIGAIAAAFFATLFIATFYKAPSCSDAVQNQDEAGVDCGGSCAYLCTELQLPPTVLFTKVIPSSTGRTDVVASVENVNATAAAKAVPYTVTLYGSRNVFIQKVSGTVDLPPSTKTPIFVLGIPSGNQKVVQAFLTIDPAAPQWFFFADGSRVKPVVTNTLLGGTADAPRIDATLSNAGTETVGDVQTIVFVRDAAGEILTASQTIVPSVPAQGQATATFTWNKAFSGVPATIEVLPVIPLP